MKKNVKLFYIFLFIISFLYSNPKNPKLINGKVKIYNESPSALTIKAEDKSILNWESFSIDKGEKTKIILPKNTSSMLNRVCGNERSSILGTLKSNGKIFLINPNGIIFGKDASVKVSSLIASTFDILNKDFIDFKEITFEGNSNERIDNLGTIKALNGDVAIFARYIKNEGKIKARENVYLSAGKEILFKPLDKERVFIKKTDIKEKSSDIIGIENNGNISGKNIYLKADGNLYDLAIKSKGQIDAISVIERDGEIFLEAEESKIELEDAQLIAKKGEFGGEVRALAKEIYLFEHTNIDVCAKKGEGTVLIGGDFQGKNPEIYNAKILYVDANSSIFADGRGEGNGGKVILWADDLNIYRGFVSAKGGCFSGDGGLVEVSAKKLMFKGLCDTTAEKGKSGEVLLDPSNFIVQSSGLQYNVITIDRGYEWFVKQADSELNSLLRLDSLNSLLTSNNVTIETTGNIEILEDVSWGNKILKLKAKGTVFLRSAITYGNNFEVEAGNIYLHSTPDQSAVITSNSNSSTPLRLIATGDIGFLSTIGHSSGISMIQNQSLLINAGGTFSMQSESASTSISGIANMNIYCNKLHMQSQGGNVHISINADRRINIYTYEVGMESIGSGNTYLYINNDRITISKLPSKSFIDNITLTANGTGRVYIDARSLVFENVNNIFLNPISAETYITCHNHMLINSTEYKGTGGIFLNRSGLGTHPAYIKSASEGLGCYFTESSKCIIKGGISNSNECQSYIQSAGVDAFEDYRPGKLYGSLGDVEIYGGGGSQISNGALLASPISRFDLSCSSISLYGGNGTSGNASYHDGYILANDYDVNDINVSGNINIFGGTAERCAGYISLNPYSGAGNRIFAANIELTSGDYVNSYVRIHMGGSWGRIVASENINLQANQAKAFIDGKYNLEDAQIVNIKADLSEAVLSTETGTFTIKDSLNIESGNNTTSSAYIYFQNTGNVYANNVNITANDSSAYIITHTGKLTIFPIASLSNNIRAVNGLNLTANGAVPAYIGSETGGNVQVNFSGTSTFQSSSTGEGYTGIFTGHTSGNGAITAAFNDLYINAGGGTGFTFSGIATGFNNKTFAGSGALALTTNNLTLNGGSGVGATPNFNAEICSGLGGGKVTVISSGDININAGANIDCNAYIESLTTTDINSDVDVKGKNITISSAIFLNAEAAIKTNLSDNKVYVETTASDIKLEASLGSAYIDNLISLISKNNLIINPTNNDAYINCLDGASLNIDGTLHLIGSSTFGDAYIFSEDNFTVASGHIVLEQGKVPTSKVYISSNSGDIEIDVLNSDLELLPKDLYDGEVFISAPSGDLSLDIHGDLYLESIEASAYILANTFNTFIVDNNMVISENAYISKTSGSATSIEIGNDLTIQKGGYIDSSGGELDIFAGNNLSLKDNSYIENASSGDITIVVDNNYPDFPSVGHGNFIKEENASITTAGAVRIFTSERIFNSISGDINGVAYVPTKHEVDTVYERWNVYYPNTYFGGDGYTIFYKNRDEEDIASYVLKIFIKDAQELFYDINKFKIYFSILDPFQKYIKRYKSFSSKIKKENSIKDIKELILNIY